MAVPTFQRFLGPALQSLSDGEARPIDDVVDLVAWHFNLSEAERSAMTRGGSNTQVRDRVNWATTYLAKAGLLSRPARNRVQITDRGRRALQDLDHGATLDLAYLQRYPEFVEFQQRRGTRRASGDRHVGTIAESAGKWNTHAAAAGRAPFSDSRIGPRDRLVGAMGQFVASLDARELLAVAQSLLVASGYRLIKDERTRGSDDAAEDAFVVLGLDALGVVRVLAHAIQSDTAVQSATIHRFVREMSMRRCRYGVLTARHAFAPDAREALALLEKDVVLIDGQDLARRLADRALGVCLPANGNAGDV